MQTFEVESEQELFLGTSGSSEGIGGLITHYNLFSQRQSSEDNYYESRGRRKHGMKEILKSSMFQKSLLALVALAVMLQLKFDIWGGGGRESEYEEELVQVTPSPTRLEIPKLKPKQDSSNHMNTNPHDLHESEAEIPSIPHGKANQAALDNQPPEREAPAAHSFSLGGINNLGHQAGIPTESWQAPMGPWDLAPDNVQNVQGHYLHDPLRSPFASHLYAADPEELERRQAEFDSQKMAIQRQFGLWRDPPEKHIAGQVDFESHIFRDVFFDGPELNDTCWQLDVHYIADFLEQAMGLVSAAKLGIQQEYGRGNATDGDQDWFGVILGQYEVLNGTAVHHETLEKLPGVAHLPQNSWDGLVRKLLHAMITEDHFYVVVAGKADTYGSNNFAQSQIMQFNYIMEPIFHKLGMTLISRNMGMNSSTAIPALGGKDIYGETDILWHIQDANAEEKNGEFDLLHRQMVLAGERVPIILSSNPDELTLASKRRAWVGNLQPGAELCDGVGEEVLACQNLQCVQDKDNCTLYNSVCWETRSDWNPKYQLSKLDSSMEMGYPGYRQHQLEGRKMALLLLHAMGKALDLWQQEINKSRTTLPLDPAFWHVAGAYTEVRQSIMALGDRVPGEAAGLSASCELLMKELDPRICHIPMHVFTDWTPRVVPDRWSLLNVTSNLILESVAQEFKSPYAGLDIVPLSWRLPPNVLDVHMISISAEVSAPDDDNAGSGGHRRLSSSEVEKGRNMGHSAFDRKDADNGSRNLEVDSDKAPDRRNLEIVPGSGWRTMGAPAGFCDGSAQSRCNRVELNDCLLANHNHFRGSLVGSPRNGWLVMTVYGARHGIILARLELEFVLEGSADVVLDYAVNGVVTSIPMEELKNFSTVIVEDLTIYPLLLEKNLDLARSVEEMRYNVAIRVRSQDYPDFEVRLSHLYYA